MRLLHDDEDASDAIQDTFEKLWSKMDIKSDEEARNKLVHALRNTCLDHLRGKHTLKLYASDLKGVEFYEMPTENITDYERLILTGLTDMQKQIYDMVTYDCLEYEEIARQMGISVEAARMHLSRARKRIRKNIKNLDR